MLGTRGIPISGKDDIRIAILISHKVLGVQTLCGTHDKSQPGDRFIFLIYKSSIEF